MSEIMRVSTAGQIGTVAALAREIWTEHYVPIIGRRQVDYMLDEFQSIPAMKRQIGDGWEYYLVTNDGRAVGYFALVPDEAASAAKLSKIYVRRDMRGRGFGREIIAFCQARCEELGLRRLWLTVNKHNADSIAFYKRMGFTIDGPVVQDIGRGFVMDDYKMTMRFVK